MLLTTHRQISLSVRHKLATGAQRSFDYQRNPTYKATVPNLIWVICYAHFIVTDMNIINVIIFIMTSLTFPYRTIRHTQQQIMYVVSWFIWYSNNIEWILYNIKFCFAFWGNFVEANLAILIYLHTYIFQTILFPVFGNRFCFINLLFGYHSHIQTH